jgi:hypothetical protein
MHYSGSYIPRWCRCSSYREITQQRRSRLETRHESYYTKLINKIFLKIKIKRSKDQTPFRPPPVLGAIPPENLGYIPPEPRLGVKEDAHSDLEESQRGGRGAPAMEHALEHERLTQQLKGTAAEMLFVAGNLALTARCRITTLKLFSNDKGPLYHRQVRSLAGVLAQCPVQYNRR